MRKFILFFPMFLLLMAAPSLALVGSASLVKDPYFGSGNYIMLVSYSGMYGDSVSFSDSANSGTQVGAGTTTKPYNLQITTVKNDAYYPLSSIQRLYFGSIREGTNGWGYSSTDEQTWVNNNCADMNNDGSITYYKFKNFLGMITRLDCIGSDGDAGTLYTIQSPKLDWQVDFKISNSDTPISKTFTSSGDWTGNINNLVFARFNGLTTVSYPPQPSGQNALISPNGNYIIDSQKISSYNSLTSMDGYDTVQKYVSGTVSSSDVKSLFNNAITNIKIWTSNSDFNQNKVSISTTEVRRDVSSISVPSFSVYINSNYINIILPIGTPSLSNGRFDTSSLYGTKTATLLATLKNIGTGTGTFISSASCSYASVETRDQNQIATLSPQQTSQTSFSITLNDVKTDTPVSCTITSKDSTDSSKTSSITVTGTIKPTPLCQEGQQYKQESGGIWTVYICRSNAYVVDYSCKAGETPQQDIFGKYAGCKAGDLPPSTCTGEGQNVGGVLGVGKKPCCSNLIEDIGGYCRNPSTPQINMLFIILPALGGLLFYLKNKKDKLYGIVGATVGLIAAFILDWMATNWLILAFGAAFGGILIYFFGTAILLAIIAIITALKGK